ncbi:hypothetical protein B0H11DRAFT_2248048 [Mycena galericulata]|nr:hypothetical protein B0H11DRAFT_2248048 [Mycena galericulata]
MDEDYVDKGDDDDPMEGIDDEEDFWPEFEQSHPLQCPAAIPTHGTPVELAPGDLPAYWLRHNQKICRSKADIVDDLRDMRNLPKCLYQLPAFQAALEESGLLALLHEVCRLGNLLETSHPDVKQSFRFHNWKMSYGRLICRWTRASISEEEYEKRRRKPDPDYEFKPKEAMDLLCFMSSHHRMHPWVHNPMAAYLFLSVDCFEFNAETWLLPCLEELNYPRVDGWNSETVYRTIKRLPLLKDTSTPDSLAFLNALEDRKLAVVLEETSAHRALMRRVRQYTWRPSPETDDHSSSSRSGAASSSRGGTASHGPRPKPYTTPEKKKKKKTPGERRNLGKREKRLAKMQGKQKEEEEAEAEEEEEEEVQMEWLEEEPSEEEKKLLNGCPRCRDEEMEDRCVRLFPVFPRKDIKSLRGVALTCAAPGDRLKPLPPPKRRKGDPAPRQRRIRYLDPIKLGMVFIKPRPHVQRRCGRDITRLVYTLEDASPEIVGGVRYNAVERIVLERLIDNHHCVKIRGVRRREEMQAWAYGSMTGSGPCQPAGGMKGDGYGPYPCHTGDTPDDIRALFRHAVDADVIIEVGSTIVPGMRTEIAALTVLHPDLDIGLQDVLQKRPKKNLRGTTFPCIQLAQTGTDKTRHEWDFAMGKWNVVIETHANTVW